MTSDFITALIAGVPGLTISVPYRNDEPVQYIRDRITNKLAKTPYGDKLSTNHWLYIDGIAMEDYKKSMEHYTLFGTVLTFKSELWLNYSHLPIKFIREKGQAQARSIVQGRITKPTRASKRLRVLKPNDSVTPRQEDSIAELPKTTTGTVTVTTDGGDKTYVNVNLDEETVAQLKTRLYYSIGETLPVERLNLYFDGRELENGKLLKDYNIQSKDVIYVIASRRPVVFEKADSTNSITIYVKTLSGKTTIQLQVTQNYDVEVVKHLIWEKLGIHPYQQRLIFHERQIDDGSLLYDCGIRHKHTLLLIHRMVGGGGPPISFADVSNPRGSITVGLSSTAPPGREVVEGTNIEAECKCTPGYRVICPQGFGLYELGDKTTECPICHSTAITPVTCGFLECQYRFHGQTGQFLNRIGKL